MFFYSDFENIISTAIDLKDFRMDFFGRAPWAWNIKQILNIDTKNLYGTLNAFCRLEKNVSNYDLVKYDPIASMGLNNHELAATMFTKALGTKAQREADSILKALKETREVVLDTSEYMHSICKDLSGREDLKILSESDFTKLRYKYVGSKGYSEQVDDVLKHDCVSMQIASAFFLSVRWSMLATNYIKKAAKRTNTNHEAKSQLTDSPPDTSKPPNFLSLINALNSTPDSIMSLNIAVPFRGLDIKSLDKNDQTEFYNILEERFSAGKLKINIVVETCNKLKPITKTIDEALELILGTALKNGLSGKEAKKYDHFKNFMLRYILKEDSIQSSLPSIIMLSNYFHISKGIAWMIKPISSQPWYIKEDYSQKQVPHKMDCLQLENRCIEITKEIFDFIFFSGIPLPDISEQSVNLLNPQDLAYIPTLKDHIEYDHPVADVVAIGAINYDFMFTMDEGSEVHSPGSGSEDLGVDYETVKEWIATYVERKLDCTFELGGAAYNAIKEIHKLRESNISTWDPGDTISPLLPTIAHVGVVGTMPVEISSLFHKNIEFNERLTSISNILDVKDWMFKADTHPGIALFKLYDGFRDKGRITQGANQLLISSIKEKITEIGYRSNPFIKFLSKAKWIHLASLVDFEQFLEIVDALKYAKSLNPSLRISFDPGSYYINKYIFKLGDTFNLCDYVFLSKSEYDNIPVERFSERSSISNTDLLIHKDLFSIRWLKIIDGKVKEMPSCSISSYDMKVVNDTGSGGAFAGGFIYHELIKRERGFITDSIGAAASSALNKISRESV